MAKISSLILFFAAVFIAAAPSSSAQILPTRFQISGLLSCTSTGNPIGSPIVNVGATLTCLNGTGFPVVVGQNVTDFNGQISFVNVNLTGISLSVGATLPCIVTVGTPIGQCTLLQNGVLTALVIIQSITIGIPTTVLAILAPWIPLL